MTTDKAARFREPRSAYIHVPFCRHRCGYCNFTLVAGRDDLLDPFLRALATELSWLNATPEIDTLYFGGGTPTHLPPEPLCRLIELVRRRFVLAEGCEFSVEANPLDVTPERLGVLRDGGVTRISLGVQSLAGRKLALLERDHGPADVADAVSRARATLSAVSVDLIFGAPGESLAEWRSDLQSAMQLQPDHVSVYGLTWERGTTYWGRRLRGELEPCAEETERAMYETAIDMLVANGYEHYEVSNFARPGFRCRHNEVYWTGGTYFAAGPGAASHVAGRRTLNHRSTTTYIRRVLSGASPVCESEALSAEDSARERLVFGLRRLEGVASDQFLAETGFDLASMGGEAIARFVDEGWLEWRDARLRLTRDGLLISDSLWPELLS
jgi:oxygen-independent coproporphyrinogen-3 oxidase